MNHRIFNKNDTRPLMPRPEASGFVKTLNQMGYMTSSLDQFSKAFVEFAAQIDSPVLEIGAAYGNATLAALEQGACVIANDSDARHLEILIQRTPESLRERLTLAPGLFPADLQISPQSVGAVLICRVLHFFDGKGLEGALQAIYQYLEPGGKLFLVADSPYTKALQSFHATYEQKKQSETRWPGLIENFSQYTKNRAPDLPNLFHALDPEILSRELKKAGFSVEKAELFSQDHYPPDLKYDGREGVGVIATKGE